MNMIEFYCKWCHKTWLAIEHDPDWYGYDPLFEISYCSGKTYYAGICQECNI